jgi:hypothetical protein
MQRARNRETLWNASEHAGGSDAQTAVVSAMASGLLRKRTADILCAASEPCCSLLPAGSEPV